MEGGFVLSGVFNMTSLYWMAGIEIHARRDYGGTGGYVELATAAAIAAAARCCCCSLLLLLAARCCC